MLQFVQIMLLEIVSIVGLRIAISVVRLSLITISFLYSFITHRIHVWYTYPHFTIKK